MSDYPSLSFHTAADNHRLILVSLLVLSLHVAMLILGKMWNPSSTLPHKNHSKVVVQTIMLSPQVSVKAQIPTIEYKETALTKQEEVMPLPEVAKEEIPILKEEPMPEKPVSQETPEPEKVLSPVVKEEAEPLEKIEQKSSTAMINKMEPLKDTQVPHKPTLPKPKEAIPPKKATAPAPPKMKKAAPKEKTEKPKNKTSTNPETKKQKEAEEKRQEKATAEKKAQAAKIEAEKKKQKELKAAQEAATAHEKALIKKAKESFAKIDESRNKISASPTLNLETTSIPKALGNLQVDALPSIEDGSSYTWGTKEMSYSSEVAYRLKVGLRFPDYGAVKIKLTLDRLGKVLKVETIQSESSKNKTYVESKIPSLLFPSFGQHFQGVSQNTFIITLQNDL